MQIKTDKIILIFALSLIFITSSNAAEDEYFPPALGPTFSWKGGTNGITTPHGQKNGFAVNPIPDAGLTLYLPLSLEWNIGLNLDLTYNTHSFLMKYNYNWQTEEYENKDKFHFSYVAIAPTFHHAGFNLGLSFGVPMNAEWEETDISTSKLNNLWEVRAGWSYPLYYDATGKLNFYINASYALNGIYSNFAEDEPLKNIVPAEPPQIITNYYNPRPAGVQIGFNFLFNLITLPAEYYE